MSDPLAAGAGVSDGRTDVGGAGRATTLAVRWDRYWFESIPVERMAVFSRVAHLAVLFTVFRTDRWVVDHGYAPRAFYQPVAYARALGLPAPTETTMALLQITLAVAGVLAIVGVGPPAIRRVLNLVMACSYLLWVTWAFAFAKVDHDRLTMIVALFVLAAVPGLAGDDRRMVGWGLRTIQVMFVLAYPLSAIAKLRRSGLDWMSSAVFARAIIRRGSVVGDWFLERPGLLRLGQWSFIVFEFAATLATVVRGRARTAILIGILALHLFTYLTVGIHFLAHTICITAFFPLERLHPDVHRSEGDETSSQTVAA